MNNISNVLALSLLWSLATNAQDCPPAPTFTPVQTNNVIEWEKFPEFSLPFTIIYEAVRFNDTQSRPLKRGFSHLAKLSGNEANTLPPSQRALTWYHVATDVPNQPWGDRALESPWGNNLPLIRDSWNNQLNGLANLFGDSQGKSFPNVDILALDIERIHDTNREILGIKNNARVPENYRNLSDAAFVERYKRDMQKLYAAPIDFLRNRGGRMKTGSYSDVMIRGSFNNWLGLAVTSWSDWTTDPNLVLHVMRDSTSGRVGGPFYNQMDFLTPSCYYYYDYFNSNLGRDYLAYILFVVEANRAWSDKPIIPYVWLRYHDSFNPTAPFVPRFVAEATAIMPFFSGAKGLWLWEAPVESQSYNYATYEYFIGGLYRLSLFKSFFEGNYELVIPTPAVEAARTKSPIWRGVAKNGEILIAAQNPYATSDTEAKQVQVSYGNWQQTITLTGREVFLCKFPLKSLINNLQIPVIFKLKTSPNPATDLITCQFEATQVLNGTLELLDLTGRVCAQLPCQTKLGEQQYEFPTQNLANGLYLVRLSAGNYHTTERVLVMK
jgi:Secretion system C-terminal sorting domain